MSSARAHTNAPTRSTCASIKALVVGVTRMPVASAYALIWLCAWRVAAAVTPSDCPLVPYRSHAVGSGWACDAGTFLTSGCMCQTCSEWLCETGQYHAPCLSTGDGGCVACPSLGDPHSRYVGNVTCDDVVCADGYVYSWGACAACPLDSYCVAGVRMPCSSGGITHSVGSVSPLSCQPNASSPRDNVAITLSYASATAFQVLNSFPQ